MNPFIHAHSLETTGFYKCNVVRCHILLRSADHTFCWQEGISVAICRIKIGNKLSVTWESSVYRKEWERMKFSLL